MTWPNKIYVATKTLGVYYTDDFSDPAAQPTWAAINTGLATTNCIEFALDPHDNMGRQYVLLGTGPTLYMREDGGSWTTILTAAEADAATGKSGSIVGFCADNSVAGRLWVTYKVPGPSFSGYFYALFTDDYGANWTAQQLYYSMFGYGYQLGHPRSNGDNVWVDVAVGAGGSAAGVYYTSNKGGSWSFADLAAANVLYYVCLNPLLPNLAYVSYDGWGTYDLRSVTNGGAQTALQPGIGPRGYDVMWFDSEDVSHQRIVREDFGNTRLSSTDDAWATKSTGGIIDEDPLQMAAYAGSDSDNIFVDMTIDHAGGQNHAVATLSGEADTTPTGIAGSNPDSAPYTDSIPYGCGGIAVNGIGAVLISTNVYVYDVLFEDATPDNASVHVGSVIFEDPTPDNASVHVGSVAFEEG